MKMRMVLGLTLAWMVFYAGSVWGFTETTNNNFFGGGAGSITTGWPNTFVGAFAGNVNTTGYFNTFIGNIAGSWNTTGMSNTFIGDSAGAASLTGNDNSFIGYRAGYGNYTGHSNSFLGFQAGYSNFTGSFNTFIGWNAGRDNDSARNAEGAHYNSFVGAEAGHFNAAGYANSFLGYAAGFNNTSGYSNSFLGYQAGYSNDTGYFNTFIGLDAGHENKSGFGNSYLGLQAGYGNTAGIGNVFLGFQAGYSEQGSNKLYIANSLTSSPLVYGEFDNQLLRVNGTLVIGGPSAAPAAVGTVRGTSLAGNTLAPITLGESEPKAGRLSSVPLATMDKVGTLKAGKWCSSLDGAHVTCTQDPPIVGQRDSTIGESSSHRVETSGMHVSSQGPDTGGWLTSADDNDFWLSSGAMYEGAAGQWIQKSFDGKAVLVGLGEEGYQVFTLSGNTVGQSIVNGEARLHIDYSGNVGLGVTPTHALHLAGGGYSDGMSWVNGSSREYKDGIESLSTEEALETMKDLNPVKFAYKADRGQKRVGFIAEDVPELVATKDRKGLSPMDIVAVLTKVVQQLKSENDGLKAKNESLENRLLAIEAAIKAPSRELGSTHHRSGRQGWRNPSFFVYFNRKSSVDCSVVPP